MQNSLLKKVKVLKKTKKTFYCKTERLYNKLKNAEMSHFTQLKDMPTLLERPIYRWKTDTKFEKHV